MKLWIVLLLCLLSGCVQYPIEKSVFLHESSESQGLLTLPESFSKTGVVLLGGSGPVDQDYTIGNAKLYRDLSLALCERGIASLRFDKRNCTSEQIRTIEEEILEDAKTAIRIMRQKAEKVIVVGHSLSAIVLPALSDEVDGMILLAGSVSDLEEVYAALLMKEADEAEDLRIRQELDQIHLLHQDSGFSWFGLPESWWISLHDLHLKERLKSLDVPVLVMHGQQDEQISCTELEAYRRILSDHPDAQFVLFPGLNHYFMQEESGHLDESVIEKILAWILKRS